MSKTRRAFLSQLSVMAGTAVLCKPMASAAAITKKVNTLYTAKNTVTIYHTNDVKGNVDAVHKNTGGLSLIKDELEKQEISGLLLDAGNFINGRKSKYQQKQLIYMMNNMGYHAAAIGRQELLMGQEHLAELAPLMKFNLLNCNYSFDNNLNKLVKPYIIITTGKFRVGITAVGGQLNGVKYNDAIASANKIAGLLKNDEKCDMVVCLSSLGYRQDGDVPDNHKLAAQSENIDLIIGSNNNKLLSNAKVLRNHIKNEVILAQAGWDGSMMGRTAINFNSDKQKNEISAKHFIPGAPAKSFGPLFASLKKAKDLPLV